MDETELAGRFGVSRTPVREALKQLAASGLVSIRPHRGAVIEQVDPGKVGEAFEAAAEMEGLAAGWAAMRGNLLTRSGLIALNGICENGIDIDDVQVFAKANRDFHDRVGELAQNDSLAKALRLVRIQTAPFERARFSSRKEREESFHDHRRIVDAIVHGDFDRARQAMRSHILRASLAPLTATGVGADRDEDN